MALTKAEAERHYFEMFSRDYVLPSGTIEFGDKPDVILRGEERTIGIEMTNLYVTDGNISRSEQVQASLRERVIAAAQRQYGASGSLQVEISLGFNAQTAITSVNATARKIASLAEGIQPVTGVIARKLYSIIPELSFVYAYAGANAKRVLRLVQVHSHGMMSISRLQDEVLRKERLSSCYRKCDAYWLLVVVDFFNPAQEQEIRVPGQISSRVFEKVIVYKPYFGHVVEVTEPSTSLDS